MCLCVCHICVPHVHMQKYKLVYVNTHEAYCKLRHTDSVTRVLTETLRFKHVAILTEDCGIGNKMISHFNSYLCACIHTCQCTIVTGMY